MKSKSMSSDVINSTPLPAGSPVCGGPAVVHLQDRDEDGNVIYLTQQHMAVGSSPEEIMARVARGEPIQFARGEYRDLVGVDYENMLNIVARGREMFDELPVRVKDRYQNNVGRFLSAIEEDHERVFMEKEGVSFEFTGVHADKSTALKGKRKAEGSSSNPEGSKEPSGGRLDT